MKNSLDKKGLSMSEATSISNICYQKALDIAGTLSTVNNYSRTIKVGGESYVQTEGNPLPSDIVDLILRKARYHATQAFLLENVKAKDELLKSIRDESFIFINPQPQVGEMVRAELLPEVDEAWGRKQLSLEEVNEYLSQEALASHVGQFIHKNSLLDSLRKELPTIQKLDWVTIKDGEKSPIIIETHHTQEQLSTIYEEFSAVHRKAEQRVNFFKAKIKNLVTEENARVAKHNATEQNRVNALNQEVRDEWSNAQAKWRADYSEALSLFEADRNKRIQEASALKIKTAPQFKATIDEILQTLKG